MASDSAAAADAFGREYFTVAAGPGRLGLSLGESDAGFVVVCALDLPSPAQAGQHERDWREAVRVGDRLVRIEGEDVVHSSLSEVISRLGKLSAGNARRLTFARYRGIAPDDPLFGISSRFDVEKLVQICAPSGPLGLVLDEEIAHGAFISAFQALQDGSASPIEKYQPRVHRGCRILAVNGADASSSSREEIRAMLTALRDKEKQLVLYRAAPSSCSSLVILRPNNGFAISEGGEPPRSWHGLTFEEDGLFRCKVSTVDPKLSAVVQEGDVLIAVNSVDVTNVSRREAMEKLTSAPAGSTLVFSRQTEKVVPECRKIHLESGPLGLNLDSECTAHAVITGFTTPIDANRPAFQPCADFLPGSFITSVNKLNVHQHSLAEISQLLMKLRDRAKDIVVGNAALMERLRQQSQSVRVDVPPGPLGLDFDPTYPEVARVSGFFPMADGHPGVVERSGLVSVGATIEQINSLDVSCLSLAQVTDVLRKMAEKPKTIRFSTVLASSGPRSALTRKVFVRVPPGPLGIDLKSTSGCRVVVDRLNRNQQNGPTLIYDHGGVIPGSELLAIDGFDVTSINLADIMEVLKALSGFEKIIAFSTTAAAYSQMLNPERKPVLKRVVVTKSPLGIEFESSTPHQATVSGFTQGTEPCEIAAAGVPIGSQVVAIEDVDLRAASLHDVAKILRDLTGVRKAVTFLLPSSRAADELGSVDPLSSSSVLAEPIVLPAGSGLQRAHSAAIAVSSGSRSSRELVRENSMPPAPTSLQPLDIRPLSASRSPSSADGAKEAGTGEVVAKSPVKTEFEVAMSSWTGARSQYLLLIDLARKALLITPVKPPTPKSGKATAISIPFAEITAIDWGRPTKPSPTKSLFRSASSLVGDSLQRCTVVVTGRESWKLDMRSPVDRDALRATLTPVLPRELKA